jgi:hypothetical protein
MKRMKNKKSDSKIKVKGPKPNDRYAAKKLPKEAKNMKG